LHPEAELLEIAIVDEHGTALLDTLVRPMVEREWPEAQAIHGIAPEDVASAPAAAELVDRLEPLLRGAELVMYNAAFDLRFLPAGAWSSGTVRCAMEAFTAEFGQWDEYFGNRRFVSLDVASTHVLCPVRAYHRALPDALRCRAVWRYLTEPAERASVDQVHAARETESEARWALRAEQNAFARKHERDSRRQSAAWMRWLRFPLWCAPAFGGHSAIELAGSRAYHDTVTHLFTGCSCAVHELRGRYSHLPEYRRVEDIPAGLVPLSRLRAPRWIADVISPRARFVPRSGNSFRLLFGADAFEEAYAKYPLRRPFVPPAGSALYTRTQLRAAGYARKELDRLVPATEVQNPRAGTWYPLFCLHEEVVANRKGARAKAVRKFATPSPEIGARCDQAAENSSA
jgi:DNA polymerase III epsilon subunit-like protein